MDDKRFKFLEDKKGNEETMRNTEEKQMLGNVLKAKQQFKATVAHFVV